MWPSQLSRSGQQENSRWAGVISLDSDCDNIGEVSEDERIRGPGNEADTLTQSMPQAIKHSKTIEVLIRVVASSRPKMVSEVILEHLILKDFLRGRKHAPRPP